MVYIDPATCFRAFKRCSWASSRNLPTKVHSHGLLAPTSWRASVSSSSKATARTTAILALLFPQATQMTCKAFSAKQHVHSQRDAICKNVLKLMRAILNWVEINGAPNSPNWSRSLEDSILKMSLPQLTWLLDRLNLPRTSASDVLGELRDWTELDLFHVLDRSSLAPAPSCRSEHGKEPPEAEKSSRKVYC